MCKVAIGDEPSLMGLLWSGMTLMRRDIHGSQEMRAEQPYLSIKVIPVLGEHLKRLLNETAPKGIL
jgi:hypothetical protein